MKSVVKGEKAQDVGAGKDWKGLQALCSRNLDFTEQVSGGGEVVWKVLGQSLGQSEEEGFWKEGLAAAGRVWKSSK